MKNISAGSGDRSGSPIETIAAAAEGLIYISETDADIEPVTGDLCDSVTASDVLKISNAAEGTPIEERRADEFFARLTQIRDWYGDREKERAEGFAKLYDVLKQQLRELRVFRIGSVQIAIYVVGIDNSGRLAGVMTRAVET